MKLDHLLATTTVALALVACSPDTEIGASSSGAAGGASATGADGGADGAASSSGAPGSPGGLDGGGPCLGCGPRYRAISAGPGKRRYWITKRDDDRRLCVRVRVEKVSDNDPVGVTVTPEGWATFAPERSDVAADCDTPTEPATGTPSATRSAVGTISLNKAAPCDTSINATVMFKGGEQEMLIATNVPIEGGCP